MLNKTLNEEIDLNENFSSPLSGNPVSSKILNLERIKKKIILKGSANSLFRIESDIYTKLIWGEKLHKIKVMVCNRSEYDNLNMKIGQEANFAI